MAKCLTTSSGLWSSFPDRNAPHEDRRHDWPRVPRSGDARYGGEAGLDVARLNFSHGNRELHAENAERIRAAASTAGRQVAILQDLPGPKLRIGALQDDIAELKPGEKLMLVCGSTEVGTDRRMSVAWGGLAGAVDPDWMSSTSPTARSGCGSVVSAPLTARSTVRSRSAGPWLRGRDSTCPAPRAASPRCPRRTSTCSASASRSAWTWSRCRSCRAPRTSKWCASTRGCR